MCAYLFIINANSTVYITRAFIDSLLFFIANCEAKTLVLDYSDVSKLLKATETFHFLF